MTHFPAFLRRAKASARRDVEGETREAEDVPHIFLSRFTPPHLSPFPSPRRAVSTPRACLFSFTNAKNNACFARIQVTKKGLLLTDVCPLRTCLHCTTSDKFQTATLFLRLGRPFTQIQAGTFRKHSLKWIYLKTQLCV